jgi:DNA polymerase delta subunit 2
MLEDESGRLRLTGTGIEGTMLVTGCIIAVMGTENANGDFEVLEIRVPDLPRQPQRWERDDIAAVTSKANGKMPTSRTTSGESTKIAIVSGLGIKGDEAEGLQNDIFMEWLLGEAAGPSEQDTVGKISRLIVAGNSLAEAAPIPSREDQMAGRKQGKKYGYDSAAYNPAPTSHLDNLLSTLLPSIPITVIPGTTDPANVSLPQQPMHSALFPQSRAYAAAPPTEGEAGEPGWFDSATNPWEGDVDGWRLLGTGGQPVDDIYKYVEGDDRLEMMENMLRWRLVAPTAPDTLCKFALPPIEVEDTDLENPLGCYPFQDKDQFVLEECPHVFFVGNQPKFDTCIIEGPAGQKVRLISVPKFKESGEVVLLDTETLEAEIVKFQVFDGVESDVR